MGNIQTYLEIEPIIYPLCDSENTNFWIKLNLNPKAKCSTVTLHFDKDGMSEYPGQSKIPNENLIYTWTPASHMRDFEVIGPFAPDEIKVAQGQGVGVIVMEQIRMYIKLIYDENAKFGIKPGNYGEFGSAEQLKDMLTADLGIGYDVLYIKNFESRNITRLCEDMDERDKKSTATYFS